MSITIGHLRFDDIVYDEESDVLYLRVGDSHSDSTVGERTPEGHVVLLDRSGEVCGVTLIGVKRLIENGDALRITLPHREELDPKLLAPVLQAA